MSKYLKYIILVVLGGLAMNLTAANLDSLMTEANNAYNHQKYDAALVLYKKIVKEGYISPKLYYNMGDTYFRMKNIPEAILYYEKAQKLDPNNADIQYNLGIANSMIVDKIQPVPEFFLKRWWDYFYNLFNADTWTTLFIISFAILIFFIGVFVLARGRSTRKWSFFLGFIFLLISITSFGLASQRTYYTKNHNEAIVFTPAITVKSSPSPGSVDLFVLHAGTKVQIRDHVDGWIKIKIGNGSIGWLPEASLRKI